MIFNKSDELVCKYIPYKLNEDIMNNISTLFTKVDNDMSLHDYIDSIIDYFYSKKILLTDVYKNRLGVFNKYKNSLNRNITNHKLITNVSMKVPNELFFKIPIVDKVKMFSSIPFENIKWEDKKQKIYEESLNINSKLYRSVLKDITGKAIKPDQIESLELYKLEYATNNKELSKIVNKLVFPTDDMDNIINYIDNLIEYFKMLKYKPINELSKDYEDALKKAVRLISAQKNYHLNVINFLLRIYTLKQEVVLNGVEEKNIEIDLMSEMFNYYRALDEYFIIKEDGFDCNKLNSIDDNHKEYINNVFDYVDKNIDVIFDKCKKELDMKVNNNMVTNNTFTKEDLDFILSNNYKDTHIIKLSQCKLAYNYSFNNDVLNNNHKIIVDSMSNIYNKIKDIINNKEDYIIYKDNISNLYNREFDKLDLYVNNELENLEDELSSNDIETENITEATYNANLAVMEDEDLISNYIRFNNNLKQKYNTNIYNDKQVSCVDGEVIQLISEFIYKCNLIMK